MLNIKSSILLVKVFQLVLQISKIVVFFHHYSFNYIALQLLNTLVDLPIKCIDILGSLTLSTHKDG